MVIAENRPTNYSVVRSELLDRLYEKMYHQRLHEPDENHWPFQIQHSRELCYTSETAEEKIDLQFTTRRNSKNSQIVETGFDLVFAATGYTRNKHMQLLEEVEDLLEDTFNSVERDYRLRLKSGAVDPECGIWLQGCCEASHGVRDPLLSRPPLIQYNLVANTCALKTVAQRYSTFHPSRSRRRDR